MKNFGIIGLGNIAQRVAKGILTSPKANLYAVASRSADKARAFQKQYDVEKAYGSYGELLSDEKVDIVYICTPNLLHYEHIMMALFYGKNVICEKPMVSDEESVRFLFAEAKKRGCFLMEAEKAMFTPLNRKLKEMIDDGVIGKLQAVKAQYCSEALGNTPRDHWVFGRTMGGCSYDIGVYPIGFSHFFAGAPMRELKTEAVAHPDFSCDFGMEADIVYQNGIYGFLRSNWLYTAEQKGSAILAGEKGYIEVPVFWKGAKAYLHKDGAVEEISVEMKSDFEGEVTHAAECVEQGLLESPVLGEAMSVEIIRVVEAVQKSCKKLLTERKIEDNI